MTVYDDGTLARGIYWLHALDARVEVPTMFSCFCISRFEVGTLLIVDNHGPPPPSPFTLSICLLRWGKGCRSQYRGPVLPLSCEIVDGLVVFVYCCTPVLQSSNHGAPPARPCLGSVSAARRPLVSPLHAFDPQTLCTPLFGFQFCCTLLSVFRVQDEIAGILGQHKAANTSFIKGFKYEPSWEGYKFVDRCAYNAGFGILRVFEGAGGGEL